jgi:pyridoxal phosphate enzyme (YggS family)
MMDTDGHESGMDVGQLASPVVSAMDRISERIKRVQETIKEVCAHTDRDPHELKLVIVTKSATLDEIRHVLDLGFLDLGENHVQQLRKVWCEMTELWGQGEWAHTLDHIRWHMIGHLQRNKVRHVLPQVFLIHSVDTLRLAEEINNDAARLGIRVSILLQVNTSNEAQKYGVPVGAATHLAEQIETLPNVVLKGLMTMAPLTLNKDVVRDCFARAHELFIEMRGEKIVGSQFTELSMGMSSDYEIAIEEGATILRIGSAIFAR